MTEVGDGIIGMSMEGFGEGDLFIIEGAFASAEASTGTGGSETGVGAFADEVAFKFGESAEKMKQQLAAGGGGIEVFLERTEPDLTLIEQVEGIQEVLQRASETIQLPDNQRIAFPQEPKGVVESLSFEDGSAGDVGEAFFTTGGL